MTKFKAYFIQCITNMHVGSGDANYGVIDKLVQRDPVTNYPTIHASSLKGALREHFEKKEGWDKSDKRVEEIFGKEGRNGGESESGAYKFLSADLIALPVRCTYKQFILTFPSELAITANEKAILLTSKAVFDVKNTFIKNNIYCNDSNIADVFAEDYRLNRSSYSNPLTVNFKAFETRYATLQNADFKDVAQKLPVIARNNVEDGTSKNLWYEEIVPHQTVFITYIGTSAQEPDFEKSLSTDVIQIGANATVGYGLCKFFPVP